MRKRKGVEPKGQNGVIWRSSNEMKEMFRKGKLLRRTVPPTPRKKERNLKKNRRTENEHQQPVASRSSSHQMEKMSATPGNSENEGKLLSESNMT